MSSSAIVSHKVSRTWWWVLVASLVIIGPLVAVLQLQYGGAIELRSSLNREIADHQLTLAHASVVRDVTNKYSEDVLKLDDTVPVGNRHDTLLAGLVQVARQSGTEVISLTLTSDETVAELALPHRYRPVVQNLEVTLSGVTYEKLPVLLQNMANARRPLVVESWQYDAKVGTATLFARTIVIDTYATY